MFEIVFFTPIFIASSVLLFRLMLVMVGLHKGPLLELFEKYGDSENHFYPIPRFLLWSGLTILSGYIAFSGVVFIPEFVPFTGIGLLLIVYITTQWFPRRLKILTQDFPPLPTWYHDLRQRTSREERRRIAYMWLRLPRRTRLLYNSNDQAFFHFADLIIMGTVY